MGSETGIVLNNILSAGDRTFILTYMGSWHSKFNISLPKLSNFNSGHLSWLRSWIKKKVFISKNQFGPFRINSLKTNYRPIFLKLIFALYNRKWLNIKITNAIGSHRVCLNPDMKTLLKNRKLFISTLFYILSEPQTLLLAVLSGFTMGCIERLFVKNLV